MSPVATPGKPADKPIPRGSLFRTLKAVLWSFVGLRKASEHEEDMVRLSPFHVIGVGLAVCFAMVIGLMFFVKWVVAA